MRAGVNLCQGVPASQSRSLDAVSSFGATPTSVDEYVCAPHCTAPEQCESNCCIEITGADYRACADPAFCGM